MLKNQFADALEPNNPPPSWEVSEMEESLQIGKVDKGLLGCRQTLT